MNFNHKPRILAQQNFGCHLKNTQALRMTSISSQNRLTDVVLAGDEVPYGAKPSLPFKTASGPDSDTE